MIGARVRSLGNVLRPILIGLAALLSTTGCESPRLGKVHGHPDVSPRGRGTRPESLRLDSSQIKPMVTELLPIDLPTVVRVALAENFDIQLAAARVDASRGEYESTVGGAFPLIVPTALFEHVEGTVRATPGDLTSVGFNTFQPSVAIQWVINPGKVIYEIIAAKKRLRAVEHEERGAVMEALRRAAAQYYELALTQARVSAANQAVGEADELLRINRLRVATGTGVRADELRAEARLAERRQDLIEALTSFYNSSIALSLTLHLDSAVTLVPSTEELHVLTLVQPEISLDELMALAVQYRPDLAGVRAVVDAMTAGESAVWWGSLGPQFSLGYQYSGITGHANNTREARGIPGNLIVNPASASGSFHPNPLVNGGIKESILRGSQDAAHRGDETFGFSDQHRATAGLGWRLGLSAFGDVKRAKALHQQAVIDAERRLDEVKAEVVSAQQVSRANNELIALTRQQVTAAEEAVRLTEANLRAGTMTTLDVLQAQDAVAQARVRYAEAVVRYNQSQVNLLASLGLLDESSFTEEE